MEDKYLELCFQEKVVFVWIRIAHSKNLYYLSKVYAQTSKYL